jgi:PAS domain S-box-containing protein
MAPSKDFHTLAQAMRFSPDAICAIDSQGLLQAVNEVFQRLLECGEGELVGRRFVEIMHPDDHAAAAGLAWSEQASAGDLTFESRCTGRAGQQTVVAWSAFRAPTDELLLCVGRNVTEQWQAAQQVRRQEELYQVLVRHGFDMVALIDEAGIYTYVGGATQETLGYRPEQLLGHSAFEFIHPEDLPEARASWEQLSAQPVFNVPDCRFRMAGGGWRWIATSISNQLQNPAIGAYALSSRDITDRKQTSFQLEEREQRFRLLFENNLSLAVFQDTAGRVLDINPAFLTFLKQPRQALINQQLSDFLPVEVRALFEQKFQEALSGKTVLFEALIRNEDGQDSILSVTKIPLVVEDKIIGVHVAAEDITEIAAAQQLIKRQAEHLANILESITDAFLSIDKQGNLNYINREAERLLNLKREECLGKVLWHAFPYQLDGIYKENSELAIETGDTKHFEVFSVRLNRWLDVKMFPSVEGLAIYLSDITERIEADKRLRMLSLVASGTDNGVVITDAQGLTIWVNDSFVRHTGYTLAEMMGQTPGAVLQGPDTDPATVARIHERMRHKRPFTVNILNYKKTGQKLWFAMDITPVYDDEKQLTHFIAIQQNINYRKEIEASQAKMTQDLYRQNRDLQQFTYVISHNLRAPLANALGLAKLLTKVDKHAEVFDVSLAHLRKSMDEADTVLQELNMVLSIRDQQDVVEQGPIAVADVCQQAIFNLEEPMRQCGGKVTLDMAADLLMHGNRAYLYSIFYNLLSNSIKYRSEERKLMVEIKSFIGKDGTTCISFIDNGSGFDMHKAGSDVFQLYKRFHTNQRGRGIGLFLVKSHVEAMGGKIEVSSGVDYGTRFLIHLDKR